MGGPRKPTSQRPTHALAVGHGVEDTTGSQPQEPAKPRKPKKKDPPPPAPSKAGNSDTGDNISDEEDAMGKRKKASIPQILDEKQEEELADWWRDNPGLCDKSNETYRRKARKDKLIVYKAAHMGVRGFDAAMLAGWVKSMQTMYGKEEKYKGKSGAAPPILTSWQCWVLDTFAFLLPHLKVGTTRRILGQVSIIKYHKFYS